MVKTNDVFEILHWIFETNPGVDQLDVIDGELKLTFYREDIMKLAKERESDRTSSPRVFIDLSGYLTIEQYAERTGKPIATVRNWIYRKKIDTITIDGTIYISENEEPRVRKYTRKETA